MSESITQRIEKNIERIPWSGCWIWTLSSGSHGYGQMAFVGGPKLVHRLAYEQFVGPIPEGAYVLHRCDTRICCNPAHLFIGTQKDNMQDCKRKGRNSKPPVGQNWKLTKEQRIEIRLRALSGENKRDLATEFEIHRSRIGQLVRELNDYYLKN